MIINPTKKALPIFNKLVKVEDAAMAKCFATVNPLFSWHANYYLVNRKKVVLLVNDLTYAAVALYDINAKNKVNLEQYINDGIREAFLLVGVAPEDIAAYFELAGAVRLNAGFNRQVTGAMTNMILMVKEGRLIDRTKLIQTKLMDYLMQIPFSQKDYAFAKDSVANAFANGLSITKVNAAEMQVSEYHVNRTWLDYHQWDKYQDSEALFAGDGHLYEQIGAKVLANNALLLAEFKNYLINSTGLTEKTAKKHVKNIELFINEFMLFDTIKTPLTTVEAVQPYLADWFPRKIAYSASEIKANATSIKKFIKFMEVAGEISQVDAEQARAEIKDDIEFGIEYLQLMDSMTDFW
ncbi:DUF6933 domain-containing protein [Loigolactobacillus backii]|uniref:DUF6933 domain-containing protein n=1 Tax=Loigolactobacillus backii TaxID=375175 RepID=A0A192H0H9_9LACO|nr:hypothetical protein [Loigolactobacillus backii]ANK61860.1 hypothetical protein AYR53_03190 [Loigolactobacillus backii]ANK68946.1 hypothetical protein AYR56_01535 [Loigolactobacillus backii]MDA5387488.1 hypothetical protein [Loigolactobacillus backii]MDA5390028.1 hypothetical protein [Loigolactobacillus backii]